MSQDCFEVDCTSDVPHFLLTFGHYILKDVNLKKISTCLNTGNFMDNVALKILASSQFLANRI